MIIKTHLTAKDFPALLKMAMALFKDYEEEELSLSLKQTIKDTKQQVFLVQDEEEHYLGFAIGSIRTDYVEGATSSPTGYLEAIYVQPNARKSGVARQLVALVEAWAKERNCTQLGSDTWEWNKAAQAFHKRIGFKEEDVLVHYIKDIGDRKNNT